MANYIMKSKVPRQKILKQDMLDTFSSYKIIFCCGISIIKATKSSDISALGSIIRL